MNYWMDDFMQAFRAAVQRVIDRPAQGGLVPPDPSASFATGNRRLVEINPLGLLVRHVIGIDEYPGITECIDSMELQMMGIRP